MTLQFGCSIGAASLRGHGCRAESSRISPYAVGHGAAPVNVCNAGVVGASMNGPAPRLFLIIATGQSVANFLPLLHVGEPGDRICLLLTDAVNAEVAAGSLEPLRQRGFECEIHPQRLPADLSLVQAWFEHWLPQPPFRGCSWVLVANGGTKVLLLAIAQALEGQLAEIVYGEGEPVSVLRLPGGRVGQAVRERPAGRALTLHDVLACTGYAVLDRGGRQKPARLLWRGGRRLDTLQEPAPWFMTAQACNAAYSYGVEGGPNTFGDAFEAAVAHRVLAHLDTRPSWHDVVGEGWMGVQITRPREQEPAADWDVLLVLRNGVLLNVECKTGQATQKELDSRWHAMRESSSQLATMWLCSPLPTAWADQPWFAKLHGHRDRAFALHRPHLAWTLPAQKLSYWLDGRKFTVPSFEVQLDELMRPYLPSD